MHACIYYSSESLRLYRCILGAIVGSFIWELIVVEDVLLSYEVRGGITPRFKELPKADRGKKRLCVIESKVFDVIGVPNILKWCRI